jgi:hypothetical protein
MTKANFLSLSDKVADVKWRWEDAMRRCQDLVYGLTLLQTRGSEGAWL